MEGSRANNFAFIDAQNLYRGVEELGWRLDYRRFRIHLREKFHIRKALIFIGYMPKRQPLYENLHSCGFEVIFKQLHPAAPSKGNVDVDLTMHAMALVQEYDQALIVTSDGDFATLTDYLKQKGKLLGVMSPRKDKCSLLLRQSAAEKMYYLLPIKHKIEYRINT